MVHDDNAVTALARRSPAVGRHRFPIVVTPTVRAFLERGLRRARHRARPGRPRGRHRQARPDRQPHRRHHPQHRQPDPARGRLQGQRHPGPGHRHHRLPHPARPGRAVPRAAARRDRPGHRDRARPATSRPLETTFDGAAGRGDGGRAARRGSGRAGGARTCSPAAPTPRRSPGSGIRCFGFAPLRLPADLNFAALFHGIDERVPVDGLQFGVRVLDRFLSQLSLRSSRKGSQHMTDQHAELDAALERVIAAARAHLAAVKAAEGRVDDDDVWQAYVDAEQRLVRVRRAAARRVRRGHAVGRRVDRPGRGRPALRASAAGGRRREAHDPYPQVRLGAPAPRLPGAQRGRAAAGGRGGPARAARRGRASRRRWSRSARRCWSCCRPATARWRRSTCRSWSRSTASSWSARSPAPLDLEAYEDDDGAGPFTPAPTTGWSAGSTSTRSCRRRRLDDDRHEHGR